MDRGEITTRPIAAADAATVADLHTTSWRSAYRGMLRDEYCVPTKDGAKFFDMVRMAVLRQPR